MAYSITLAVLYMEQPKNVFYRNQTLSITKVYALRAFRTSPVSSFYAKAQRISLENRRKKLSMDCVLKLKTCPNNHAYNCVFEPPNSKLFETSKLIPSLSLRVPPLFEDSKIDLGVVDDITVPGTPPWSQSEPKIGLS